MKYATLYENTRKGLKFKVLELKAILLGASTTIWGGAEAASVAPSPTFISSSIPGA
jgi:hypothetical protein